MTKKSGTILDKPRHPEGMSLKDALAEDQPRLKALKGNIDKRATLIKAVDGGGDADAGVGATMRPTDEQLTRINQFTRRPVTADEVVAFPTLSCNDITDRDDDKFSTQCVKDFAELPQPFSPTGKSYMLDHDYTVKNAVGRIFGTDTKKVSDALFLTNEIYMPNTDQFKPLIERIDFGINWAVSVGVTLGKSTCTVCDAGFSSWGYWCANGHDKGMYYDPDSDLTDDWGYPLPCDPKTKGAVKCVRMFDDPRDMYELSQVFLGAQYFAALEKEPSFAAVMKSASADVPIIGLSAKEAEVIKFRHEHKKVSEARKLYELVKEEDGTFSWTDSDGLRWNFDPETPEEAPMSLGKADDNEGEEDGEHSVSGSSRSSASGEDDGDAEGQGVEGDQGDAGLEQQGSGPSEASVDDEDSEDEEEGSEESEESEDDESEEDDDESSEDEESEKSVSKKAVLETLAKRAHPKALTEAVQAVKDGENAVDALLQAAVGEINSLTETNKSLTEKATLGDLFLKELRAEAIDAYVRNHATADNQKVSVETFERLLDKCGDDVELLKSLYDMEMSEARKKFPEAVRRSSFPSDPNQPGGLESDSFHEEPATSKTQKSATRIHG